MTALDLFIPGRGIEGNVIFGELNVVAVDFPSHRSLPFSDNISFFQENDQEGFIQALIQTIEKKPLKKDLLQSITLNQRTENLLNFIT